MAFPGTNYGDVGTRVGIVLVAKWLAHAENETFLEKYAMQELIPKNKGQTLKFKRAVPLNVSASALTEGVTTAPTAFEDEIVTVTISQYGAWMGLTDVVMDTHEDPILNKMTEVLGEQSSAVKELIIWNTISAGTNVIYANGTTRAGVNTPLTLDDIRAAVRHLKFNRAKKITKRIAAGPDISTEPVNASFMYYGNIAQERDFREMDSFVPVERYSNFSPVSEYEIGKVEECRVVLNNHAVPIYGGGSATLNGMLSRDGTNVDVFLGVVFGQDAFGATGLKGMNSASLIVKNPVATYEDPHAQRGFVSWKFWFASLILNQNWIVRLEAGATDL